MFFSHVFWWCSFYALSLPNIDDEAKVESFVSYFLTEVSCTGVASTRLRG